MPFDDITLYQGGMTGTQRCRDAILAFYAVHILGIVGDDTESVRFEVRYPVLAATAGWRLVDSNGLRITFLAAPANQH